ncbi:MAG: twin-arginine translocase TatA/TatE family subunit [Deltaproteobacteria bacterium]|nr:twin-arginine translocase TatA/TatE family subunit [Deltaproteobacteria bacterium]
MFGISTTEFMLILAVALVVFGPQKLPEIAKAIGRAVGEFRKATSEIKETFEADENLAEVKRTFEEAVAQGMNPALDPEETALSDVEDMDSTQPEARPSPEPAPEAEEEKTEAARPGPDPKSEEAKTATDETHESDPDRD